MELKISASMLLVFFYTPQNHQKSTDFFMFSEGIESNQWHEMDPENSEAWLATCQVSMMKHFCEDSQQLLDVNCLCKIAPSLIFDRVLNTFMMFSQNNSYLKNSNTYMK